MNTYLEIDLAIARENIEKLRLHIGDTKLMAVVKGDAYGHGMVKFSKHIEPLVDAFGVGMQEEGVILRKAGIEKPILILSPYFDNNTVYEHGLIPSIDSIDRLVSFESFLKEKMIRKGYHLILNTGMNRFGLEPTAFKPFLKQQSENKFAKLEGIYSHFAYNFRQNPMMVKKQLNLFKTIVKSASFESPPFLHMANSEIAIDIKEAHFHMVRIGNGLYGPCSSVKDIGLQKVAQLKANVIDIRKIPKGSLVGYGATKKTTHNMTAAYLALGYREGYQVGRMRDANTVKERLKQALKIILDGKMVLHRIKYRGNVLPVIGKANMQFLMVDITRQPQIELGTALDVSGGTFFVHGQVEKKYIHTYDGGPVEEALAPGILDDAVGKFNDKK